jgi:hypothetical protein
VDRQDICRLILLRIWIQVKILMDVGHTWSIYFFTYDLRNFSWYAVKMRSSFTLEKWPICHARIKNVIDFYYFLECPVYQAFQSVSLCTLKPLEIGFIGSFFIVQLWSSIPGDWEVSKFSSDLNLHQGTTSLWGFYLTLKQRSLETSATTVIIPTDSSGEHGM